jgi:DNA polymerase-3 subunit chi
MTADVMFCVLEERAQEPADQLSCIFAEQCLQAGMPLCIHVEDADRAAQLDQLLWTFRDISFVPHCYADDVSDADDEPGPPIAIAWPGHVLPSGRGVLFHLAGLEPERHEGYTRLIEMVPGKPGERRAARARYRRYRDLGCTLDWVPGTADRAWMRRALNLQ